jgi:hypothetical protein
LRASVQNPIQLSLLHTCQGVFQDLGSDLHRADLAPACAGLTRQPVRSNFEQKLTKVTKGDR